MLSDMTVFIQALLASVADFLLAEPIIYVVAVLLLIVIVRVIKIILS